MSYVSGRLEGFDLAAINTTLCEELRTWLSHIGCTKEADRYYWSKIENAAMLSWFDVAIAHEMCATVPHKARADFVIYEPGAGYGQLSILLAFCGFATVPVEMAETRHSGTMMLARALGVADAVAPLKCFFPQEYRGPSYDGVVATNVINGAWGNWKELESAKWTKLFGSASHVILDLERWGIHRAEEAARQGLLDNITLWTSYSARAFDVPQTSSTLWHFTR